MNCVNSGGWKSTFYIKFKKTFDCIGWTGGQSKNRFESTTGGSTRTPLPLAADITYKTFPNYLYHFEAGDIVYFTKEADAANDCAVMFMVGVDVEISSH